MLNHPPPLRQGWFRGKAFAGEQALDRVRFGVVIEALERLVREILRHATGLELAAHAIASAAFHRHGGSGVRCGHPAVIEAAAGDELFNRSIDVVVGISALEKPIAQLRAGVVAAAQQPKGSAPQRGCGW